MIVLGIETSCDETSVALIKDGNLLSNEIYSQIDIHAEFGGVVPEIASRNHLLKILPVFNASLGKANISINEIDGIAVTNKPGLIGSLLIGLSFAKSLSYSLDIPIIGINHLEAHLNAVSIENKIAFPFIGLIVSGGHTSIYNVNGIDNYGLIGSTRDDAAGEVFDKVAKVLDLGYPGGPIIDRLSNNGNPAAINFPRGMLHSKDYDFSFSGLKTAVINYIRKNNDYNINDIAASFSASVIETLTKKTIKAAIDFKLDNIIVSGGVAANSKLRQYFAGQAQKIGKNVYFPSKILCTDNAAMVAYLGQEYFKLGKMDSLELDAYSYI
ncbi:MAG: tRNA (adenosine(37)-N6)-threonylcarbamoyltransferase complex transferase subunit TsaD [Pseudomonadota bacterium]